jgi:hypothetical protein
VLVHEKSHHAAGTIRSRISKDGKATRHLSIYNIVPSAAARICQNWGELLKELKTRKNTVLLRSLILGLAQPGSISPKARSAETKWMHFVSEANFATEPTVLFGCRFLRFRSLAYLLFYDCR